MNLTFTLHRAMYLAAVFLTLSLGCHAQKLLNSAISLDVRKKPVSEVLKLISEQGKFNFSYNSNLVPGDSLVTLNVQNRSVRFVLDAVLLGVYQYKETGDYIIIQRPAKEKSYYLTGRIYDNETGKEADYASVYSKQQLASALSDDQGYFRLRLRERTFPLSLTISKVGYADTTIVLNSAPEQDLSLTIYQKAIDLDPVLVRYSEGGGSWLARMFVSSRLRLQSRNISRFFVSLPYQASFTPGLSTQGKMSTQVSNKLSLNILGGYTAGVNGVELAGWFNISKKDVRYVQIAGMFNIVSGQVDGVQIAGFHNHVLDSLNGVQISGLSNQINKSLSGVQVSGWLSRVSEEMHGAQVSGVGNIAKGIASGGQVSGMFNLSKAHMAGLQISGGINLGKQSVSGMQLAGLGNSVRTDMQGLQLAGLYNYARNLKGVQVGIINLADTSSGYSVGLINIVKKGKGAFSLYANEILPLNLAWKSGNRKLYNIFMIGTGVGENQKAYTFGFGIGKEFVFNKFLSLNTEFMNQNFYLGQWKNLPVLYRFHTGLNVRISKRFAVFGGPSFNIYNTDQKEFKSGYQTFSNTGYYRFKINNSTQGWVGWQGGLAWNYSAER